RFRRRCKYRHRGANKFRNWRCICSNASLLPGFLPVCQWPRFFYCGVSERVSSFPVFFLWTSFFGKGKRIYTHRCFRVQALQKPFVPPRGKNNCVVTAYFEITTLLIVFRSLRSLKTSI